MDLQFIEQNGQPAFVVLAIDDYNALISDEELMRQSQKYDDGVRFPSHVTNRIIERENAVKVIREWRDITQSDLAQKAGLSANFISMIETGRRNLTAKTSQSIADVLGVDQSILQE